MQKSINSKPFFLFRRCVLPMARPKRPQSASLVALLLSIEIHVNSSMVRGIRLQWTANHPKRGETRQRAEKKKNAPVCLRWSLDRLDASQQSAWNPMTLWCVCVCERARGAGNIADTFLCIVFVFDAAKNIQRTIEHRILLIFFLLFLPAHSLELHSMHWSTSTPPKIDEAKWMTRSKKQIFFFVFERNKSDKKTRRRWNGGMAALAHTIT